MGTERGNGVIKWDKGNPPRCWGGNGRAAWGSGPLLLSAVLGNQDLMVLIKSLTFYFPGSQTFKFPSLICRQAVRVLGCEFPGGGTHLLLTSEVLQLPVVLELKF